MQEVRFIRSCLLACLAALLLHGCGIPLTAEQFDQTAEASYLQATLDKLAAHDYAALEAAVDPRLRQPEIRQAFQQMAALLPPGPPTQKHAVSWNFTTTNSWRGAGDAQRTADVAVEYGYPAHKWLLVSAKLTGEPGNFHILGFHINPLSASLEETNAFSFRDKSVGHYAFFLTAVLTLVLVLFAFIRCLRMKGLKRKWLWAILTLLTVSTFTLNWTTGEINVALFTVNLFGWGVQRHGWLSPWLVVFPMPIGAIVFLWRFRRIADSPRDAGGGTARP